MGSQRCLVTLQVVLLTAGATHSAFARSAPQYRSAEMWRIEPAAPPTPDASIVGDKRGRVGSYLLLLRLEQERFHSVRLEMRDGWIVVAPRRRSLRLAGHMVARTAFHVLAAESSPQVKDGLLLLGGLFLETGANPKHPVPRLVRQLKLGSGDVEQHAGYATIMLRLLATPTTRLVIRRGVTRAHHAGGGRRRAIVLPTLRLPGPDEPPLTGAELMQILLGQADARHPRRTPW